MFVVAATWTTIYKHDSSFDVVDRTVDKPEKQTITNNRLDVNGHHDIEAAHVGYNWRLPHNIEAPPSVICS